MTGIKYGVIANGKPVENVTVTSFVDWEDIASHKMAEAKAGRPIPIMPLHKNAFQKRLAHDKATDIRLFPVGSASVSP